MTVTDQLLKNNENYIGSFAKGELPLPPAKHLAVLACMDARLVHKILGLEWPSLFETTRMFTFYWRAKLA